MWRVRFSSPTIGKWYYETQCSDSDNDGLNKRKGEIYVSPYDGTNELLKHGALRVSKDYRFLEHSDGKPFFWMGEICIYGLCKRLTWPEGFRLLADDRVKKGFTAFTLTAGLYPGPEPQIHGPNPRHPNEAGLPWENDFNRINPYYFDMADLRIQHLVEVGLLPVICGSWGYIIGYMGTKKMKQHWRYLIGRYAAYPVVWCMAAEPDMALRPALDTTEDRQVRRKGWTEVAQYIRKIDPYRRLLTNHSEPWEDSRDQVEDPSLVDFEYIQTSHGDWFIIGAHAAKVIATVERKPRLPVIIAEACFEGHAGTMWEDVQRFLFWSSILSGTCGYTYGAESVFTAQTEEERYQDQGGYYSDISWKVNYQLPGSTQVGIGRRLLERYPWWRLEPHPEWVKSCRNFSRDLKPRPKSQGESRPYGLTYYDWPHDKHYTCYAAGIPKELRIVYFPVERHPQPIIQGLESDIRYRAYYFDPRTGKETDLGMVEPTHQGEWRPPKPFIFQDGILVLERS